MVNTGEVAVEYDSKMMEDLKAQIRMLRAHNAELEDNVDECRSGMVSYEHLRAVMGKLSILLIRTDRGVYKKKYRKNKSNDINTPMVAAAKINKKI